jgi:hypothetical protein
MKKLQGVRIAFTALVAVVAMTVRLGPRLAMRSAISARAWM